jgi:hypothetical protein
MRPAVMCGTFLGLSLAVAGAASAQTGPAYVGPRLPIGDLRFGTGHVTAVNVGPGLPLYVGPVVSVGRSLSDDLPPEGARVRVYVVVPDLRVRPSEVIFEPPEVYVVPARPQPPASGDDLAPGGT